jgi:hypothetical protein
MANTLRLLSNQSFRRVENYFHYILFCILIVKYFNGIKQATNIYLPYLYVGGAIAYKINCAALPCPTPLTLILTLSHIPNISTRRQLNKFLGKPNLKTFMKYPEILYFVCNRGKISNTLHEERNFIVLIASNK